MTRYRLEIICPNVAVANEIIVAVHDHGGAVNSMTPEAAPAPAAKKRQVNRSPNDSVVLVKKDSPFQKNSLRARAYTFLLKKLGTTAVTRKDIRGTLLKEGKYKKPQIASIFKGLDSHGLLQDRS